jgi:hypothetical protein
MMFSGRKYKHRDEKESISFEREDSREARAAAKWFRRRVYTGSYYRRDLPPGRQSEVKAFSALLYVAAVACFFYGGAQKLIVSFKYVYLPTFAGLLASLTLLGSLAYSIVISETMTDREYKLGSIWLKRASLTAAFSFTGQSAVLLAYVGLRPEAGVLSAKVAAVCAQGAAGLLFWWLYYLEKAVPYVEENRQAEAVLQ